MNVKFLTVLLTATLPSLALGQGAQNYQCTYGDLKRRIEIFNEPGVTVPCEVHYFKDTEAPGEQQVLWRAMNESGYCERKTQEFIAKLEGLGWQCGQSEDAAKTDNSEHADVAEQDAEAGQGSDTVAPGPGEDAEPETGE